MDSVTNLKGMLLFNPFTYVDALINDSMLKCIYSFEHCPESLSEYMDYFYSVLTLAADRIPELQAPKSADEIAASHLKKKDRIAIFKGCLGHVDFRKRLKALTFPITVVHSKKNCLVQIKHSHDICDVSL